MAEPFVPFVTDFPKSSAQKKAEAAAPGKKPPVQPKPKFTPQPPIAVDNARWRVGDDPAAYTRNPGSHTSRTIYEAGQLVHARPFIASGSDLFVFPVGVEGFERSGQATLGVHKYLGENATDVHVFHREEGRIELTGSFPGLTSPDVMRECIRILTSIPPEPGLVLVAPGVFETEQYVTAENWRFTHGEDDRTHSIDYAITLVRSGTGKKIKDPTGKVPPPGPQISAAPKAKGKTLSVASGAQTFYKIAEVVYNGSGYWQLLIPLNDKLIRKIASEAGYFPAYSLRSKRWPIGTKINY